MLLLIALAADPSLAQPTIVDVLLERLFSRNVGRPYELTADFTGTLDVTVKMSRLVVEAEGSFLELRGADGIRRRKVTVRKLSVPFILRPFASSVRRVIEEKIETSAENPETFHNHDLFLLAEEPDQFVLAGIHRSIVDEAIDRYGHPEDKLDTATRRKIAEWLYTAPTMQEFIVRPGPPYALRAAIDDGGLLRELVLSYDWGAVSTVVEYTLVNGRPVWATLQADTVSDISGVGRVTGKLLLRLSNHCVNCHRPP
jgi:hypothetical protein